MGKKVRKKAISCQKEKRVLTVSPKTTSEQSNPSIDTLGDKVPIVKERKVCPHLDKGIDLAKVSSRLGSSEPIRCNDCREGVVDKRASKGKGKHGKKKGSGSLDSKSNSKAIWVCLQCGHFSCGGVGFPTTPQCHAVRHARQNRHPLAVQFENPLLIWCFPCNNLIPVEKSEENGKEKDVLHDIVKMIKVRPSEGASVDVENVWFGSGSIISEVKSENTVSTSLDGRGGYVVRGLVNLGNTCFFNSIMQNLLALDRMRDLLLELDGSIGPLTAALKKFFTETSLETGLRNVMNPRSFFGCLCVKAPQFRGYQQHDSHELLRCLLDGLCTEESSARKQTRTSQEDGISSNAALTFVDEIFGGQLSSTISCLECGHSSVVYEPFLDLSLPVPTKKPLSKKAQPVSRAKKPKLPPKRSGRIRSKVTKDANPLPAQSVSDQSTNCNYYSQVQSGVSVAEKLVVSSGNATLLESVDPTTVSDDKSCAAQNISVSQESENKNEDITTKTTVSLDNAIWLDYLKPDTMSNDHDMASDTNDITVIQDCRNKDAAQNHALSENTLESSGDILSKCMQEPAPISGDLTWLDYCEPDKPSDDPQLNDNSLIQDSGNKDAVQNDSFLKHGSESGSQVCSVESNLRVDYSVNSWEDEAPLRVQDSEVLLLPYKEDTSTTGEISRGEGAVSSLALGCEQDSLDFDGFGDLFNEPEAAIGPCNTSDANEVAETGFMVGNSSESDPDEVDNTSASVSVESCLAYFTKPELLSKNENAWHCENCSKAMQEQKKRQRKKWQTPKSKLLVNGGEDRNSNALLGLNEDCPCPTEIRSLNNGNVKSELLGNSNEHLVSQNGGIVGNQKTELDLVVSLMEDGKVEMDDALPNRFHGSSGDKTSSQASFNFQASDSCSVNEPGSAGCSSYTVQQKEGQLLACQTESEGSEDDAVDSESVKVKRDATKRILINKVPPILTIHLKRFSQDARGRLSKLNGHVDFGEMIDLKQYMDPRCTDKDKYKYRLVGVVEHSGHMRSGHYIAYVRGGIKNSGNTEKENSDFVWYHASDAYVREASLEEVLRSEAYLLFYEEI